MDAFQVLHMDIHINKEIWLKYLNSLIADWTVMNVRSGNKRSTPWLSPMPSCWLKTECDEWYLLVRNLSMSNHVMWLGLSAVKKALQWRSHHKFMSEQLNSCLRTIQDCSYVDPDNQNDAVWSALRSVPESLLKQKQRPMLFCTWKTPQPKMPWHDKEAKGKRVIKITLDQAFFFFAHFDELYKISPKLMV